MGDVTGNKRLEVALKLAAFGFYVFPLMAGSKVPPWFMKDWGARATRDPEKIKKWWGRNDYNIGIFTGRFKERQALCVVDVDVKKKKKGMEALRKLEAQGVDFSKTWRVATPSGGMHLYYICSRPVKSSNDRLGDGLDIRSAGAYVVGPFSTMEDESEGH